MAEPKFLLDTNIFIALEDPKVVPPQVAVFAQKSSLHGVALYLDEACVADIRRDPNLERRTATLSKLAKFPLLESVAHRGLDLQQQRFGAIKNEHDRCDVQMLDTLDLGIVDFLISEDLGIHRRADMAGLRSRVFTVQDAIGWIQRTFEPKDFQLRYILARKAHQISIEDPLFLSLREDYPEFDQWFAKCRRQHRDCWTVEIAGQLAGLVIRKEESHAEARTVHPGPRILKICTLKMKTEFQGEKFGEQLLKKIFWFAQGNAYNLIYLTVFPKQEVLIPLLQKFGFSATHTQNYGELVMERPIALGPLPPRSPERSALAADFIVYPRFYEGTDVAKYIVPIRAEFHIILFPEIAEAHDLPMFPNERFLVAGQLRDRTPGNTIRKVYICRAATRSLKPGDVLLFYLSKTPELSRSQCLTTLGIVEQTHFATTARELIQLVGRRSVYSHESLDAMIPSQDSPVLVIEFLLSGHLDPPISLSTLLKARALTNRPAQSIKRVDPNAYEALKLQMRVGFQ